MDIGALSLQPALRNQLRSLSVLSFEAVCSAQPPSFGPNAAHVDHHMAAFLGACAASSSLRELHLHSAPSMLDWIGFAEVCLSRPRRVAPEADAALAARLDDYTVGARGRTGTEVDVTRVVWVRGQRGPVLATWGGAQALQTTPLPADPCLFLRLACTPCLQVEAPSPPNHYSGLLGLRRGTRHRPWEFGLAAAPALTVQRHGTSGAPLHLAMPVPTAHEALAELVAAYAPAARQTPRPELTELWLNTLPPPGAGVLEGLAAAFASVAAQGAAAGSGAAAAQGAADAGAASRGGSVGGVAAALPELRVDLSQHPRLRRFHLRLGLPSPVHHEVPADLRLLGCPPSLRELGVFCFGWATPLVRFTAGLLDSLAEQVRAADGEQGKGEGEELVAEIGLPIASGTCCGCQANEVAGLPSIYSRKRAGSSCGG
jgi:hypothetical protein